MGKPTAFMHLDRKLPPKRPASTRVQDYREIYLEVPEAELRAQASRCMECGIPFCHQGCPLGNLIPDFNDLVFRGRMEEAAERLALTNNFPELTGRLCPAPCEASCVLNLDERPVTIKEVEKAIAETMREGGVFEPFPRAEPTGRSVAVIGSGPAGLAAAQQLARQGHAVTVFERADRPGGLLRYGIPDFKLERHVLDARLTQLAAEGVTFECGRNFTGSGEDLSLLASFDAICLAVGACEPRGLDVPGNALPGVMLALPYLEQENRIQLGERIAEGERVSAAGRHVLIIGGGDTGADCLGTALRQGAASTTQLEISDRPPDHRASTDLWPQWPNIFRVSPAHEEGGEREFAIRTLRLEGTAQVERLVAEKIDWISGAPVSAGEEIVFPADLVLIATGYTGAQQNRLYAALGLRQDPRGRIVADAAGRTENPNVFVCGDARRGASLVVWAIAEGRKAAESISLALEGRRLLKVD